MSLVSLVPDGRRLTVAGVSASSFYGSWLWLLQHRSSRGLKRLSVGVAQGQEGVLRATVPAASITKSSASAHGGALVALKVTGGTTVAWVGENYELSTHIPTANSPLDTLTTLLDDLVLTESSDGLQVLSKEGSGVTLEVVCGANMLRGAAGHAGVQVDPIGRLPALPAGDGETAAGGRLWRVDEYSSDGSLRLRSAVLVGDTTVTRMFLKDPDSTNSLNTARSIQVEMSG